MVGAGVPAGPQDDRHGGRSVPMKTGAGFAPAGTGIGTGHGPRPRCYGPSDLAHSSVRPVPGESSLLTVGAPESLTQQRGTAKTNTPNFRGISFPKSPMAESGRGRWPEEGEWSYINRQVRKEAADVISKLGPHQTPVTGRDRLPRTSRRSGPQLPGKARRGAATFKGVFMAMLVTPDRCAGMPNTDALWNV